MPALRGYFYRSGIDFDDFRLSEPHFKRFTDVKYSAILYPLSTALVAVILTSTAAFANGAVSVMEETTATIGFLSAKEFNVSVVNEGFANMEIYAVRTVEELPDQDWFSTICMGDLCYAPSVSTTNPVIVPGGAVYKIKFTVYSGEVPSSGAFQLKVFAKVNGEGIELGAIDFSVSASDESSVPVITQPTELRAYPSPAASSLTITGTDITDAERLEVLDAAGRVVMTLDGAPTLSPYGVSLDVSTLPAGAYFFRLVGSEAIETGRFVVTR